MVLIPREPRLPTLGIAEIERENIDGGMKGMPAETSAFPLGEIGLRRWNILSEDLPFPLAVLKESALAQNSAWMRTFLRQSGALIAPHGKTTMSPQLFQRQLDDGAWGITVATVHQLRVCRRYGVQRVILANQLLGRTDIQYVIDELRHDPDFDFYCLVDSLESVDLLADSMRTAGLHRPLQLLLEVGFDAGRAGARGRDEALDVARRVAADAPLLTLRGVEGFEGLISGHSTGDTEASVSAFLDTIVEVAEACEALNLFGSGPVILTAGGSSYYDLVARCFARVNLGREVLIVVRSGCYLTHDSRMYADQIPDMLA
ncbi:MAG TPA: alanine racemase, partial [Longimicrobiaceae bacterium]|nr:alanine racemase [Longimicrobiaceae bacterium]